MAELLLLGAGHAHVEVLRRLALRPLAGWRVTLLTPAAMAPYSGMLPGVLAGRYRAAEAMIDVAALAARAAAALVLDRAVGLDLAGRTLRRAAGAKLRWDLLSIDTGATPDAAGVPGAVTHALALKPIEALLPRLAPLLAEARPGQRILVVGAGAAGVEVALALAVRLPTARLALLAGAAGLLPGFPERFRRRAAHALAARRVGLRVGLDVTAVSADALRLADGAVVPADAVVWATGAAASPWLAETGLERDGNGFLRVDAYLRALGRADVFAAGDVAAFDPALPKAGVFAVRQGPVLAANLRAAAEGRPPRAFLPQRDYLRLLSLGDGRALGTRNGAVFGGRWVWWLKDAIDRRFIARYAP